MSHHAFGNAELQPMELSDINTFIDHWHHAVHEELQIEEDKSELASLASYLKEQVQLHQVLRRLATNPLLCAMLCALNRERRQHLPINRVELYRSCCELLLERKEKGSRIDLRDYPAISLSQKERLLQDFAYWMIQKNLSEAESAVVDERFTEQISLMPSLSKEINGAAVRRLFVERSGIMREPVLGRVDFTHRTFQEFFAVQAALDETDINKLVANAHHDQWSEVIVLYAGLASKEMSEKLILGLIKRGDEELKYRHFLHLLAVSCLETVIQLPPKIRAEVEKRLEQLVPPKNMTEATALASAGHLAVPYLAKKEQYSTTTNAACVCALSLIGGDAALKELEEYVHDSGITDELWKAWDSFDERIYAQGVLSQVLRMGKDPPKYLSSLNGFQYFTNLTSLDLSGCSRVSDTGPLASLTRLTSLDLSDCWVAGDSQQLEKLIGLK